MLTNSSKLKLAFLPVETKSREFDSKCLVALSLIQKGAGVLLTSNRFRFEDTTFPGVILLKSAANFELEYIKSLKKRGIQCCVLDEEGLVHTAVDREHALRFSQNTIDAVDKVLFNGAAEKSVLENFYKLLPEKSVITGNPRFDLYKPEFSIYYEAEAKKIKAKYGKFILIPSRFGMVNFDLNAKDAYLSFVSKLFSLNSDDRMIFEEFEKHSKTIYQAFIELIPHLSRSFPDINIIIRPHPSESASNWDKAIEGCPNVKVVTEGAIGPWLLASEIVLHNGCTTGLEAFLLGKPVLSYMPVTSESYDLKIPNDVSIKCFSQEELLESLVDITQSNPMAQSSDVQMLSAQYYLHNATSINAYENVALALINQLDKVPYIALSMLKRPLLKRFINKLKKVIGLCSLFLINRKMTMPSLFSKYAYSMKKNPGFTTQEINKNLLKFSKLIPTKREDLIIKKIDEDAYLVYLKVNNDQ